MNQDTRSEGASGSPRVLGPQRPANWLLILLGLLTVALIVCGIALATNINADQERSERRDAALKTAQQHALSLLGISDKNVDERIQDLLDNSTGSLRKQLQAIRSSFGQVVKDGEVTSTGRVDLAAIASMSDTKARILLALSSTVTNKETEKPEPRVYRISVDLEWRKDRWLVSGMEFAP